MLNLDQDEFFFCSRFSSYTKLVRFVAWTLRFMGNCRVRIQSRKVANGSQAKIDQISGEQLTQKKIQMAEIRLLRNLQSAMFNTNLENKLLVSKQRFLIVKIISIF